MWWVCAIRVGSAEGIQLRDKVCEGIPLVAAPAAGKEQKLQLLHSNFCEMETNTTEILSEEAT